MLGVRKRIKIWLIKHKSKAILVATTLATLGETIDTSSISNMINSMLPLIISMIGIAIPLIFIKYIMKFLEKILSGFG